MRKILAGAKSWLFDCLFVFVTLPTASTLSDFSQRFQYSVCKLSLPVGSFKYLGALVSDEGSKPEVLSRIAKTTASVTKLKVIWIYKNIAISSKIRQMCSLTMSIFLHACETWTITADIESIQTLEMRCFHKLFGTLYRDRIMRK